MITNKQKVSAIIRKIKPQFPTSPEGKMFFSVVELALKDLCDNSDYNRATARSYINNDLSHAEACGVSRVWIRELFAKADCEKLLGNYAC